jgi:linoleoyl-CoA desaturase
MWKHKHNIAHHSFTNIEGMDEDIDIKPFLRVNASQKRYWFHRFQHIYGLILYGFTYLMWIFFNDFKKYFSRKVTDHTALPPMNLREHLAFWLTKIAYAVTFFILPVWQVGLLKTLLGYGMLVFVTGILIAIVFQLAHVHEEAAFVQPQGAFYNRKRLGYSSDQHDRQFCHQTKMAWLVLGRFELPDRASPLSQDQPCALS